MAHPVVVTKGLYDCVLVGAYAFPAGDASSNRMLSLAKTFAAAGYRTLVVNDASGSPLSESVDGSVAVFQGVNYICTSSKMVSRPSRIGRLWHRVLRPVRVRQIVRKHLRRGSDKWVCVASGLYSIGLHFALRLVPGVRLIADVVERHDADQFSRGGLDPYYLRHRYTTLVCRLFATKIIAISSELSRYFEGHKPVIVLPPAVDMSEFANGSRPQRDESSILTLLYMGRPGRKDLLGPLLRGILALNLPSDSISLVIAGANNDELTGSQDVGPALYAECQNFLTVHGFVSREHLKDLLAVSDFTVLLRPTAGYASYGFPSKVPESLAAGCPVIANMTSDLSNYLIDGVNSLICRGSEDRDVAETITRALLLSTRELAEIKASALRTAWERFDYTAWAPGLRNFLAVH